MADTAAGATEDSAQHASQPQQQTGGATENGPPVQTRKCIVLTGYGGMKHVKVMAKEEEGPGPGQVKIRVKACGLGFQDIMTRQGLVDQSVKPPFTLGFECAGEVEALGDGVVDIQVEDRVIALQEFGCWADSVVVPAEHVYKIPSSMTYPDAAGLVYSYLPAYIMLYEQANIRSGDTLLVHSAGGSVGLAVAQLCRLIGDVHLYGTASKEKHGHIQEYYNTLLEKDQDYASEIKKLSPEGLKVVLDCLAGEDINRGLSLVKPTGKYILYGASNYVTGETKSFFSVAKSWWQVDRISPMRLQDENKQMGGFSLKTLLFKQKQIIFVKHCIEKVLEMYVKGQIKPVVDSTWAFDDVCEAMQRLHDRKNIGKVILDPNKLSNKQQEALSLNFTLITVQSDRTSKDDEPNEKTEK